MTEFDEEVDLDDEEELEQLLESESLPEYHMEDAEVELTRFSYSDRAPTDFVISGPLGDNDKGPGRRFFTIEAATRWARGFYGRRLMGLIDEAARFGGNRWAFLIRPTREK